MQNSVMNLKKVILRHWHCTTLQMHVMPLNSEPVPKDKIVSAWGGAIRMRVKDIKLTTDDVTGNGELAGETGKYEMYGDNNKLLDKGKYVVIWKNENGEWKL
jgi:ketosteroid isomerase-like protein